MVWFCIALFIHAERLGPVGLWADEMTELGAREHDDGLEEDELRDVALNEKEVNYNIQFLIIIM